MFELEMSPLGAHTEPWLGDVTQLLDEHHVAVLSDDPDVRSGFVSLLTARLRGLSDTEAVVIPPEARSGEDVLRALVGNTRDMPAAGTIAASIAEVLRARQPWVRRRYVIWSEAEAMLEHDVRLFGEIVHGLCASAAEREFVSDDALVIQRSVFVGGSKLGAYAEEPLGQFRHWLPAGPLTDEIKPFIAQPRVLTYWR